jgi:hypothetical protein
MTGLGHLRSLFFCRVAPQAALLRSGLSLHVSATVGTTFVDHARDCVLDGNPTASANEYVVAEPDVRASKSGLNTNHTAVHFIDTQDGISVWAPFGHDHETDPNASPNDFSYLLSIQIGKCQIVLGGDTDEATWKKLYDRYQGNLPKIQLLKASHHGRKSGYHMPSARAMNPDLTVVSVGELKDKHDAAASYEKFSNKGCYSTIDQGDIIARCWVDGEVWLFDRDWNKFASSWE